MRRSRRRRGLTIAALLALGATPFLAMLLLVASPFVSRDLFRAILGVFAPPGLDAPDNWAVAITRVLRLFQLSGSVGLVLMCLGLWLAWRNRATRR